MFRVQGALLGGGGKETKSRQILIESEKEAKICLYVDANITQWPRHQTQDSTKSK